MNQHSLLIASMIFALWMPGTVSARIGDPDQGILLVVGDENGTSEPGKGIGDLFIRTRLEKVLGHKVTLGLDSAPADELQAAAAHADLVIVSESTSSVKLKDKLKPVETPIINYEAFIQDEMGLTAIEPSGDPGEPADFAYGVKDKETRISIVAPAHPLAAGATGTLTVYREPKQVTWGKVGENAEVIATLPGEKTAATIYVYQKGAELFDGTTAAGLRVGFFLEDDDETGTANLMTDDGLRLFDAAVKYSLCMQAKH
jgi:hypothetical protein